jgi:hypothetical protein
MDLDRKRFRTGVVTTGTPNTILFGDKLDIVVAVLVQLVGHLETVDRTRLDAPTTGLTLLEVDRDEGLLVAVLGCHGVFLATDSGLG